MKLKGLILWIGTGTIALLIYVAIHVYLYIYQHGLYSTYSWNNYYMGIIFLVAGVISGFLDKPDKITTMALRGLVTGFYIGFLFFIQALIWIVIDPVSKFDFALLLILSGLMTFLFFIPMIIVGGIIAYFAKILRSH
jgi:hypothetical protein